MVTSLVIRKYKSPAITCLPSILKMTFKEDNPVIKTRLRDIIKPAVPCIINRDTGTADIHLPALMPGLNFQIPWNNPLFRIVSIMAAVKDVTFQNTRYAGSESTGTPIGPPAYTD